MSEHRISPYLEGGRKRSFDLAVAGSAGLVALAGGLVAGTLIAVANRVNPVLLQERRGLKGNMFKVIKLRTMGEDGKSLLLFGESIRDRGLDETPQMLNIIQGSMSAVGYRPLLQVDINHAAKRLRVHFTQNSPYYPDAWLELRDQAKPGATGPSQTMPRRSDSGSISHLAAVIAAEREYLETATITTDLGYLAITPRTLFSSHNPTVERAVESL